MYSSVIIDWAIDDYFLCVFDGCKRWRRRRSPVSHAYLLVNLKRSRNHSLWESRARNEDAVQAVPDQLAPVGDAQPQERADPRHGLRAAGGWRCREEEPRGGDGRPGRHGEAVAAQLERQRAGGGLLFLGRRPCQPHAQCPRRVPRDYILDFEGNTMCVNAVRFSPNGECLATGGDDGYVIVWFRTTRPLDQSVPASTSWHGVRSTKQLQRMILRGKLSEICDLAWTSDSKYIVTGSVDGTVGVWNVCAGKLCQQTKDHKGFVQGVSPIRWESLLRLSAQAVPFACTVQRRTKRVDELCCGRRRCSGLGL